MIIISMIYTPPMMIIATVMTIISTIRVAPQKAILIVITSQNVSACLGFAHKCPNFHNNIEIYEGSTKPTTDGVYKQNCKAETILSSE